MNVGDVARFVVSTETGSGLSAKSELVVEANGFVLAVEKIEQRGNKVALVAATPTIEDVVASLDAIQASMTEHLGKPPPEGSA